MVRMSREAARNHEAAVAAALAGGKAARSPIVASWARSANHGLAPSRSGRDWRLDQTALRLLRERMEPVSRAARPTLERLFQCMGGFGASVILASEEGIPFERLGREAEDRDFTEAGLALGADWSESAVGTNGIGTCLAERRAVVVDQDQHFLTKNTGLTCVSSPVHDAMGALVAVLDVSTVRRDLQPGLAGLLTQSVSDAARKIEADLFQASFPEARIILVPGAERPDRGSAALLAVDADELVIGATYAARLSLGLTGDLRRNPKPAGDLLGLTSHRRPEDGERAVLARALARSGGNMSAAARELGISRATLHRKLGRSG